MTEIRKLEPLPIEREDCCVELDDLRERVAKARLEGMEEAARICDEREAGYLRVIELRRKAGELSRYPELTHYETEAAWCAAEIRAKSATLATPEPRR